MSKNNLDRDKFRKLLSWLDPEPTEAGKKYEEIRRRLIKIFVCRGCLCPEELADATIDRVADKVEAVRPSYQGDPARYFYGVAKWIHHEHLRKPAPMPSPSFEELPFDPQERRREDDCLERCLERLEAGSQELVLQYYSEERSAKIRHRRNLARSMGIRVHTLRMRVHRIRRVLEECVLTCLRTDGAESWSLAGPTDFQRRT